MEAPPGTSLKSLVKSYLLTHQTEGSSPHTVEYYRGILGRFLWYAAKADWVDDARLLNEWHIREFLFRSIPKYLTFLATLRYIQFPNISYQTFCVAVPSQSVLCFVNPVLRYIHTR